MSIGLRRIGPAALRDLLAGDDELAVIDTRPAREAGERHILAARPVPLDRLALDLPDLVPRRDTPVVLIGDGAEAIGPLGYRDVATLDGGLTAWQEEGGTAFAGIRSMSKAFGEFIQSTAATPTLAPAALRAMAGRAILADVRAADEYAERTIPGAIHVAGGDLLRLAGRVAGNPMRPIVLTCASETRGLVAAQSLIDAGVPNPVYALAGGVMAWMLAGLPCQEGRPPQAFSASGAAPRRLPREVPRASLAEVTAWQADEAQTTYVFDLRPDAAYATGHLPGARPVTAGQLIQALDRYAGTWRARIVLIDDDEGTDANWAGWWLKQLGWQAFAWMVSPASGMATLETGAWQPRQAIPPMACWDPRQGLPDGVAVLDVGSSVDFRRGHIPGAIWARGVLDAVLQDIPAERPVYVTSPDGLVARHEAAARPDRLTAIAGGTVAWQAAGGVLEPGGLSDAACIDVILRPFDRQHDAEAAMRRTLGWRVGPLEAAGMPVRFMRMGERRMGR